jgi:hypothetical protein
VSVNAPRDVDADPVGTSPAVLIMSASFSTNCDESIVTMSIYIDDVADDSGVSTSTCTGAEAREPICSYGRMMAQSLPIWGASEYSMQACIIWKMDM